MGVARGVFEETCAQDAGSLRRSLSGDMCSCRRGGAGLVALGVLALVALVLALVQLKPS